LAPAIQQGAQFINMMSQQRAAERQAAAQEQTMRLQMAQEGRAAAGEARAAELHPSAVSKAQADAMTAEQKATIGFYDLTIEGLKRASTPQQAMVVADYLKQKFPGAAPAVDQTMSTLPSDPGQFEPWRKQTMFQSMTAQQQLAKKFITQNTGTGTRQLEVSEFEPGVAAQELPGSRTELGQEVTYITLADGSRAAVPKRLPAGGGGIVGGVRGSGATGGVQIGQPIAGTGKPADAAAAAKPGKTTESERRFGTIAQQMGSNLSEAVRVLTDNPEVIRPTTAEYAASQIPFYGEEARLFAESEARQQFVPAVLRFLDNITFVNTGAGTSKAQEENYRRSYVPTYQDTPGSAHRKLKNMVTFAKNVKSAAGSLWTPQMDADFAALETAVDKLKPPATATSTKTPAPAPASKTGARQTPAASPTSTMPKVGTVDEGYRFKGGDPTNAKNWEKVR
jgi:type II secretory pathway pseudopilin PulG